MRELIAVGGAGRMDSNHLRQVVPDRLPEGTRPISDYKLLGLRERQARGYRLDTPSRLCRRDSIRPGPIGSWGFCLISHPPSMSGESLHLFKSAAWFLRLHSCLASPNSVTLHKRSRNF